MVLTMILLAQAISAQRAAAGKPSSAAWSILFDGTSTSAWRGFRSEDFPPCWVIEEGTLRRKVAPEIKKTDCGDIITRAEYTNFELEFEWRSSRGGNSGVKYLISEDRPDSWEKVYMDIEQEDFRKAGLKNVQPDPGRWKRFPIGFEFQLIDDDRNPDARISPKRVTGALYDILAPVKRPVRPAGQYNRGRILVRGNHVEHWINGVKVLEYEFGGQALKNGIAASKFKPMEGFGIKRPGHIDLQDHDTEVWFRNIRIRELPAK